MSGAKFAFIFLTLVGVFVLAFLLFQRHMNAKSYPLFETITNVEGKSIDGRIIGKIGSTLYFEMGSSDQRYEIELDSLIWKDRNYLSFLPEIAPPVVETVEVEIPDPQYIALRKKEIAELERKRQFFEKEIRSGTLTPTVADKRTVDIYEVEQEIKKLELAIEQYKWQRRLD